MIEINNVSFSYGNKEVLNNISYDFDSGKCYCIVGENGAGKTTLLECMLGIKQTQGSILYDKQEVDKMKSFLGVVFQENALTPRLKVKEELAAYKELFHVSEEWLKQLIDIFELKPLYGKYGNKLSGGERRRVLMALAFMNKPKYLILDEPFTGVDTKIRIKLRKFMEDYAVENNAIVIFSEHNILECKKFGYVFLFIFNHQIYLSGTSEEILKNSDERKDIQDLYLSMWEKGKENEKVCDE